MAARRLGVGHHDGERLGVAALAPAQLPHRRLVARVRHEVEAAEALHSEERALAEPLDGEAHRVLRLDRRAEPIGEREPGAARGARVRLRVVAPILDVLVLVRAGGAHREALHRGLRPVVRHVADDRVARPAMGAVDERVAVTAVGQVPELPQAVGADVRVGRDERVGAAQIHAAADLEVVVSRGGLGERLLADARDPRERRRRLDERAQERLDRLVAGLQLEQHAAGVVEDPAARPDGAGEPVHEGPEADALDDARDPESAGHDHRPRVSRVGGVRLHKAPRAGFESHRARSWTRRAPPRP